MFFIAAPSSLKQMAQVESGHSPVSRVLEGVINYQRAPKCPQIRSQLRGEVIARGARQWDGN